MRIEIKSAFVIESSVLSSVQIHHGDVMTAMYCLITQRQKLQLNVEISSRFYKQRALLTHCGSDPKVHKFDLGEFYEQENP